MADLEVAASGQASPDGAVGARPPRRLAALRASSVLVSTLLLVEYGLGMGVSLYLKIPAGDRHHGFATALGRALTSQPAALAIHTWLGLAMLLGGISVLVRAVRARHGIAVTASATALLAIIAAAVSGAGFVDQGQAGASMAMAVLTGVALLCYLVILLTTVPPAPVTGPQR